MSTLSRRVLLFAQNFCCLIFSPLSESKGKIFGSFLFSCPNNVSMARNVLLFAQISLFFSFLYSHKFLWRSRIRNFFPYSNNVSTAFVPPRKVFFLLCSNNMCTPQCSAILSKISLPQNFFHPSLKQMKHFGTFLVVVQITCLNHRVSRYSPNMSLPSPSRSK